MIAFEWKQVHYIVEKTSRQLYETNNSLNSNKLKFNITRKNTTITLEVKHVWVFEYVHTIVKTVVEIFVHIIKLYIIILDASSWKKLNKKFPMFFSPSIQQFFQKPKDCLMTCDRVAWLETNTTQHIERNKKKNSFFPLQQK